MKVIVINLKKSLERLYRITQNLNELNIPFERFNAIYGKDLSKEEINNSSSFIGKTLLCNHGIIGCALSHIAIWKQFKESNEEFILISEDDIVYTKKFPKLLKDIEYIYKTVKFDILSLNCCIGITGSFKTSIRVKNYEINNPIFPLTTASYIVSKKGANLLLKMINKVNYHIDFEIAFRNLFNKIEYRNIKYPELLIVTQDNNSTISVANNGLMNKILRVIGCDKINWFLSNTVFTLFLNITISIYAFILIFISIICLIRKKYILFCIFSIEFILVMTPIKNLRI